MTNLTEGQEVVMTPSIPVPVPVTNNRAKAVIGDLPKEGILHRIDPPLEERNLEIEGPAAIILDRDLEEGSQRMVKIANQEKRKKIDLLKDNRLGREALKRKENQRRNEKILNINKHSRRLKRYLEAQKVNQLKSTGLLLSEILKWRMNQSLWLKN